MLERASSALVMEHTGRRCSVSNLDPLGLAGRSTGRKRAGEVLGAVLGLHGAAVGGELGTGRQARH
jgi:hypothetical protein